MPLNDFKGLRLSRRNALKAGFGGVVATQLALIELECFHPVTGLRRDCHPGPERRPVPDHSVRHR